MLRWCLPEGAFSTSILEGAFSTSILEGAFSTLDGAVASVEWVWYNQEDRERHNKQLHRAAKKVSCTGHAA